MTDAADPALWTLAEASAALAGKRIGAVELLEASLARIAAWQDTTGAFIDLRADAAWAATRAADAAGARRSALHGIPLAHKDLLYRAGQVSTCGSVLRRDWRAPVTATVLERLDAAGAVDLGTLAMAEWAGGATGHNKWFGDARNPWHPAHVTGGSSSGSGAAVAARMVFAALGSDTGGSIRIPAAMCGVTGLKPSWGAVSRAGAMPRAWSLDCIGPLARTAEDCALLFGAIAGPDPHDPTSLAAAPFAPEPATLRGRRIGVARAMLEAADAALEPALDGALRVLQREGAVLRDVVIPGLDAIGDLCGIISNAEAAAIHAEQLRAQSESYAPDFAARSLSGFAVPAVLYIDALRLRARYLAALREAAFADCEAIFAPTVAVRVPLLDESRTERAEDVARLHGPLVRMTRPFSYLGLPVLAMPCGFDDRGLPVGFQLAGDLFAEARLLSLGAAFQSATDFHARAPTLPATSAAA